MLAIISGKNSSDMSRTVTFMKLVLHCLCQMIGISEGCSEVFQSRRMVPAVVYLLVNLLFASLKGKNYNFIKMMLTPSEREWY